MLLFFFFFFFNDTATTEIYTLSLHDALPISGRHRRTLAPGRCDRTTSESPADRRRAQLQSRDRKSTRLNSSHSQISYAVFCLKKKKKNLHALHKRSAHTIHSALHSLTLLRHA